VICEQQSRVTSYQRRKGGLSKKAREWSMRSQPSYYGYLSVQRNVTGSQLRSPLLPCPVTPVPGVSKTVILVRFYRLLITLSMCSLTVHLADTRPHSRTTLTYEPITHTSFIGGAHAIYREADHGLPCAYRLLSFSVCPHGSHNVTLLIVLFLDGALNPPSSSPPPYPRRHVLATRSIIICPRQTIGSSYSLSTPSTCTTLATRSATTTPTQVTLTCTIANAATTMTPSGVARPLS